MTTPVVALDPVATIELAALSVGIALLLYGSLTRQRWDTISELFWLVRDAVGARWGRRGLLALASALAAGLGWAWWHLIFG